MLVKNRNSSFDVLKIFAMLIILASSSLPYGATYQGYGSFFEDLRFTSFSFYHISLTIIRWGGQIGDILFLSVSAWFLCDRDKINKHKLIKMIMDSWFISVIGLCTAFAFFTPGKNEILHAVFPITFDQNWFVGCYIAYYLVHPFINKAVEGVDKKRYKIMVILLFVLYSVLQMLGSFYYFNSLVFFISMHLIVRYIKQYGLYNKVNIKRIWFIIVGIYSLLIGCIIMLNLLGSKYEVFSDKNLMFCRFNNPMIVILGLMFLMIVTNKTIHIRFVDRFSSLSLIVYLLHGNYFWLSYGKYFLYDRLYQRVQGLPMILYPFIVLLLYICIIPALAYLYEHTVGKLTGKASGVFLKIVSSSKL